MSHYEKRVTEDLTHIQKRIDEMGKKVEEALRNAVHALVTGNNTLAYNTILGDLPINRYMRQTEKLCYAFLAVHLPTAGLLRRISSAIRTNISLERIGDYAVTICREAVQLSHPLNNSLGREVELMAKEARNVLHLALATFSEGNADKARATQLLAAQTERTFDAIYANLVSRGEGENIKDLFGTFVIFSHLGRISDQAKNICEDTVFASTGETKPPKVYNILFLDEDNTCQSQIAEAIANKLFPIQGVYTSAGRISSESINLKLVEFFEKHGMDSSKHRSTALDFVPEELADFHVIVSLQGPVKSYISAIPFHTVALEWDVGSLPQNLDEAETNQRLEEIYREIALLIQDLMETLRGDEGA